MCSVKNYYPEMWVLPFNAGGLNRGAWIIGHGFTDNGKTFVANTDDSKVFLI